MLPLSGCSPFLEPHYARQSVPSYRLHKPSGQARTIIHRRHIYLGKYNSPESREKNARPPAELSQPTSTADESGAATSLMLVSELLLKYLEYTEDYDTVEDKGNKEFPCMITAVKPVNQLYGNTLAIDFVPPKLPFAQGLPLVMNSVLTSACFSQRQIALDTKSGPLSLRSGSGVPQTANNDHFLNAKSVRQAGFLQTTND